MQTRLQIRFFLDIAQCGHHRTFRFAHLKGHQHQQQDHRHYNTQQDGRQMLKEFTCRHNL